MSEREPDRLTDASDDPLLRELLGAGRKELPDEAQLAAVMAKLGPVVGPGGGGGSGGGASGATKAAWIGSAKVVAVIGGLTAALWGMSDLGPKPGEPPREVTHTEIAASAMTAPVVPSASATPAVSPSAHVRTPPPAPSSARHRTAADGGSFPDEVELVQQALDALTKNPATALALADEHEHRYPEGLLRQEAEVIAIDALARAHQTDAARARATKFRAAYPTSPHLARIETILQPKP